MTAKARYEAPVSSQPHVAGKDIDTYGQRDTNCEL
jgi:hypothetical protein